MCSIPYLIYVCRGCNEQGRWLETLTGEFGPQQCLLSLTYAYTDTAVILLERVACNPMTFRRPCLFTYPERCTRLSQWPMTLNRLSEAETALVASWPAGREVSGSSDCLCMLARSRRVGVCCACISVCSDLFVRQFHESEYSTCSNEPEFPLCLNSYSVKCLLTRQLLKEVIISIFDSIYLFPRT